MRLGTSDALEKSSFNEVHDTTTSEGRVSENIQQNIQQNHKAVKYLNRMAPVVKDIISAILDRTCCHSQTVKPRFHQAVQFSLLHIRTFLYFHYEMLWMVPNGPLNVVLFFC